MELTATETLSACPICGGGALLNGLSVVDHSISNEEFRLVDCSGCGFRFTNPRPTVASMPRFYDSDDYISHTNSRSTIVDQLYQIARNRTLRNKQRLIRSYHSSGGVLDIGCGTGEFLERMRRLGYQVQGVEPSAKARARAHSNHDLPVVADLDRLAMKSQYEVITLWHVLEHLHNPGDLFLRLGGLLAPGGYIFIAVPDRGSWDCSHYGAEWAAWDVPRHLSHFRQIDLETLLSRFRFQLVSKRRMLFDAPYVSLLSERNLGVGGVGALARGILFGTYSNAVSLLTGRPSSSTLFIAKRS